jgi:hypothetical protein
MIAEILRKKESAIFLSFLIGFGLAVLMFHRPFFSKRTLSLPLEKVHGSTVKSGSKCYKYFAEDTQCEILPSK